MRDFLMGGGTGIRKNAITAFGNSPLTRDMPQRADHGGDLLLRSLRRKVVQGDVFPFWDHEDMRRGSRGDVAKGEDVLNLIDLIARDLAPQDAGEDVVAVVDHP